MDLSKTRHQSVRDYIAARKRGDAEGASRIAREVADRFATRTTDGSEAAEIYEASMTIPLGESDADRADITAFLDGEMPPEEFRRRYFARRN